MVAQGYCHVLIGQLLVHPCARPATARCTHCQQPTCAAHVARGGRCVVCAGEHRPARPQPDVTLAELVEVDPRDAEAFATRGHGPPGSYDS